MPSKPTWQWTHTLGLLLLTAALVLVGLYMTPLDRRGAWLASLLLLAIFAVLAGQGVTGLWKGLLIDERNMISLSRFQLILWTLVVLSGFLVAGLANVAQGEADPLSIAIPAELWLLMGISTTSLVGSPLIKSPKKGKTAADAEKKIAFDLLEKKGVDPKKIDSHGQIVVNTTPDQAEWSNMFEGEETGNAGHLDLAKIQMFLFTVIIVLTYGMALGQALKDSTGRIGEFPSLDPGVIALLGISHAGYLTSKALPHSQSK